MYRLQAEREMLGDFKITPNRKVVTYVKGLKLKSEKPDIIEEAMAEALAAPLEEDTPPEAPPEEVFDWVPGVPQGAQLIVPRNPLDPDVPAPAAAKAKASSPGDKPPPALPSGVPSARLLASMSKRRLEMLSDASSSTSSKVSLTEADIQADQFGAYLADCYDITCAQPAYLRHLPRYLLVD